MSHVDDLKLSHKDPTMANDIIAKLESIYATINPMTAQR